MRYEYIKNEFGADVRVFIDFYDYESGQFYGEVLAQSFRVVKRGRYLFKVGDDDREEQLFGNYGFRGYAMTEFLGKEVNIFSDRPTEWGLRKKHGLIEE